MNDSQDVEEEEAGPTLDRVLALEALNSPEAQRFEVAAVFILEDGTCLVRDAVPWLENIILLMLRHQVEAGWACTLPGPNGVLAFSVIRSCSVYRLTVQSESGVQVHLDGPRAMVWLKRHRSQDWTSLICLAHGARLTLATFPGAKNRWYWSCPKTSVGSPVGFSSAYAAACDLEARIEKEVLAGARARLAA